ncbi:methionyl-tRNA formyltransferase [bacterium]|nr:methionyl-tRNA formyltransferase [bacterium]
MNDSIVYFGASEFSARILEGLITSGVPVRLLITYPDKPKGRGRKLSPMPTKVVAKRLKIPVLEETNLHSEQLKKGIKQVEPYLGVVIGFRILPEDIFTLPEKGTINLHPSLLPDLRGPAPLRWAILYGYRRSGITIFFINKEVDAGEIIYQSEITIDPDETHSELEQRVAAISIKPMKETIEKIFEGNYISFPQPDIRNIKPAPKIKKSDRIIKWSEGAEDIHNRIRALSERPGAFSTFKGRRVIILKSIVLDTRTEGKPGKVVSTEDIPIIQTGKGLIGILFARPESRQTVSGRELVNGLRIKAGDSFM